MKHLPAVMIGGPPHSGKSVLIYSLSRALREARIDHYVLRACPDGEGDWANEIDQGQVRIIRVKNDEWWTQAWVDSMCRDIEKRHLPLLVDVGGRPTTEQEAIFSHCTHAILLTATNQLEEERPKWRAYARRHGLTVLADLESSLNQPAQIFEAQPHLLARLSGLERGKSQTGPVFNTLVAQVRPYLSFDESELRALHLASAPTDTVIDLNQLAATLGIAAEGQRITWKPEHLPAVLDDVPQGEPLAVYGRGPNWLYAALAVHALPRRFYQFDVRLGWISPPSLTFDELTAELPLTVDQRTAEGTVTFDFKITDSYLNYTEAIDLTVPPRPKAATSP